MSAIPVTLATIVHDAPAASVAPLRATLLAPAAAVTVPATQVVEAFGTVATVTPLGKAPTATLTFPVKPFIGDAATTKVCAAPPEVIVSAEGAITRVKSAVDFGLPPPPHPVNTVNREIAHRNAVGDCIWISS